MNLRIIFVLVIYVELAWLKPSENTKDYLKLRLDDQKFSGEITLEQRIQNREQILKAFFQTHSPNFDAETLNMIKMYASCQETVNYQNASSPIDYTKRMRKDVAQTKITARNAWGGGAKDDTAANELLESKNKTAKQKSILNGEST